MDECQYEFRCPECDFTHKEAGRLAKEQEKFCGMCAGDKGEDVRLRRWLPAAKEGRDE
jgi:hypothetical protein